MYPIKPIHWHTSYPRLGMQMVIRTILYFFMFAGAYSVLLLWFNASMLLSETQTMPLTQWLELRSMGFYIAMIPSLIMLCVDLLLSDWRHHDA
ncbi:hypothetical protein CGG82_17960 [Vibrio parahaemolyticus]|uniref:hypothetical protein n=1 Tax=Vibrio parahaemolyticus TaxID=670 RepID=UPI00111E7D98|nr:hypothetical protein [Vibrio parahaemolyticus]TOR11929.1 hypothetical protein CGG82_17960 [Vibrio parahaemolyticus]UJX06997.1 hypothetical protein JHS88_25475 [Vibrio parahaemolyticus]WCZ14740.1 hypothetical protein GSS20_25840 [Vibrio parahaemolyticus]